MLYILFIKNIIDIEAYRSALIKFTDHGQIMSGITANFSPAVIIVI